MLCVTPLNTEFFYCITGASILQSKARSASLCDFFASKLNISKQCSLLHPTLLNESTSFTLRKSAIGWDTPLEVPKNQLAWKHSEKQWHMSKTIHGTVTFNEHTIKRFFLYFKLNSRCFPFFIQMLWIQITKTKPNLAKDSWHNPMSRIQFLLVQKSGRVNTVKATFHSASFEHPVRPMHKDQSVPSTYYMLLGRYHLIYKHRTYRILKNCWVESRLENDLDAHESVILEKRMEIEYAIFSSDTNLGRWKVPTKTEHWNWTVWMPASNFQNQESDPWNRIVWTGFNTVQ